MKLNPIANPVDETILRGTTDSGLAVLVNPRPDYVRTFAALGVNFGSVDRVGGTDGQPVPEGLAHFLEHKLFEDADGDVSDRFAKWGADVNAMTGFTGTTYVVSTVEQALPSLDLLLDFVQDPWFTDELVEKEQGIIAQEIRMYDDDPEWRIFFGLLACLYESHPVRDNIAGSVESIAKIDAATLRRCYDMFYHPTNMCLAISGPVDPAEVMDRVERDQADRNPDGRVRHERVPVDEPVTARAPRFEERLLVARPRWLLGIKETVLGGDPEAVVQRELSTRILMDILFGRSSAAFESMYAEGLIDESFGASHTAEPTFGFTTVGSDTDDPERLGTRVAEVFAAARSGGLDQDAWQRIRKKLLGSLLRGLDSVENTAFALMSDTFRGVDPFRALELLERISLVDLQQRLEEHVRDDAMATAVVLPRSGP